MSKKFLSTLTFAISAIVINAYTPAFCYGPSNRCQQNCSDNYRPARGDRWADYDQCWKECRNCCDDKDERFKKNCTGQPPC